MHILCAKSLKDAQTQETWPLLGRVGETEIPETEGEQVLELVMESKLCCTLVA